MSTSRRPELDVVAEVVAADAPSSPAGSAIDAAGTLAVTEAVVRRVPWAMLLPLLGAMIGVGSTVWMTPSYTTTTTFITESSDRARAGGSAFAGLASQLGVGAALGGPTESPQFHADLVRSRQIGAEVLATRVRDPDGATQRDSTTLMGLLAPDAVGTRRASEEAFDELQRRTFVAVNPRTSVIELRVSMPAPDIAIATTSAYLAALDRFNRETRASQGRERRRFAQARLREAQDSLAWAEGRLRAFLERNRGELRNAPALFFEQDRLQRMVSAYTDLATTLRNDYEAARLDEVNDRPVITVIDPPVEPSRRSSPRRSVSGIIGLSIGALLAVAWLVVVAQRERLRRARPGEYARLADVVRALLPWSRRRRATP